MSRSTTKADFREPSAGPVFSLRFLISLLLFVGGIALIAYYYIVVRPSEPGGEPGGPKIFETLMDWKGVNWDYLIGFAMIMFGLALSAHPSTPMGRGRGVVIGMLGCFIAGLIWICTFYVVSDDPSAIPVINDLGQYNLAVGIAFMAVGFTFATRWE